MGAVNQHDSGVENTNLSKKFIELSCLIANHAHLINIPILPFENENLKYFNSLPLENRREILKDLSSYLIICQKALNDGHPLTDSRALLWNALKELKLIPCSDLFSTISDGDIVEIYNLNNIQIFRNFKFFELCGYTLEDLYCRPWTNLFYRPDHEVTNLLIDVIKQGFKNNLRETTPINVPTHLVEEISSSARIKTAMNVKFFSPLFDKSGAPAAYIAIEEARLLKSVHSRLDVNPPLN